MYPIDIYRRVFVCKSGLKQKLETENEELTFVGIGRIGDRKGRTEKRFIQDHERKEVKKLLKTKDNFDILITHDKDDSSQRGYGMAEIRDIRQCNFSLPFLWPYRRTIQTGNRF